MKENSKEPQPFGGTVRYIGTFTEFRFGISKQRSEEKYFEEHSEDYSQSGVGTLDIVVFNPR
jgi:hypothetical protein